MKINEDGLNIIKHYEGWSSTPYLCPAGIPTIGYGSIWDLEGDRVTMEHREISEKEGEILLLRELSHIYKALARLVKVPLTANQYSALCSFCFNVGTGNFQASTLRNRLNRKDYSGAASEFWKWRRGGGRILPGLVRRRKSEEVLFRD